MFEEGSDPLYYDSGYTIAGVPVHIGHGFDEDLDRWDIPVISFVDHFYQAIAYGRIQISSRDVLLHGAAGVATHHGIRFALAKGFLDPVLFGTRYGPLSWNAARMGANRVLMAGAAQAGRGLMHGVAKASPHITVGAVMMAGLHGWWSTVRSLDWVPNYYIGP